MSDIGVHIFLYPAPKNDGMIEWYYEEYPRMRFQNYYSFLENEKKNTLPGHTLVALIPEGIRTCASLIMLVKL